MSHLRVWAALPMCMCKRTKEASLALIWRNHTVISERADFDERYFPGLKRSSDDCPASTSHSTFAIHAIGPD
ncbi:hypothetical protein SERLA73DRAFT_80636 [Serpula lacrymans var. lacrymans S7.3]|uniref:Uncharacterized protein n=1 Tax=Serpula lacrymans var. lacrymans (strain S7.3) TaxID=936435 RepID=F8QK27_SERL3|nr:hypothetical protein SERLA73DRAFT_80636 [Serpula lacrymans var. lacrymans S7.3]